MSASVCTAMPHSERMLTFDVAEHEVDCLLRSLMEHVETLTRRLREPCAAQLSAVDVAQLCDEIRIAATLAGRLPYRPKRRSEHEQRSS